MKRVALFSTYCNSEEKEKTLLNNIRKVKNLGLDVFVITVIPLSKEIHDESDYIIYSKENPVPPLDFKSICSWRSCKNNVTITSFFPDYGYASLLQLKRLIDFSSVLDYDYYFTMIYDIIITTEVEKVLIEGRDASFFKNPKVHTPLGGILTAFNKKNAKKFASLLTPQSYYNRKDFTAEQWMLDANSFICGKIEDIHVADSINLNDALLATNHSPFQDFSLFIIKDKDVKLFFYDLKAPIKLIIETNIRKSEIYLEDQKLVHIYDKSEEIKYIKINYNGIENNLSNYLDIILKTNINGYSDEIIQLS